MKVSEAAAVSPQEHSLSGSGVSSVSMALAALPPLKDAKEVFFFSEIATPKLQSQNPQNLSVPRGLFCALDFPWIFALISVSEMGCVYTFSSLALTGFL